MKRIATKEVTECCPFCDKENTWEYLPIEKRFDFCQDCGRLLHFCDECMYNNNEQCNPLDKNAYCHEHYIKEPIGFKEELKCQD